MGARRSRRRGLGLLAGVPPQRPRVTFPNTGPGNVFGARIRLCPYRRRMPRRAQAEDWRAVRALRLRALADAPEAFEMTLAQAEQWTDEDWRRRVAEGDERVTFVEEDEDGNLVGMAVGLFDPAARVAHFVGMFVEPGKR